MVACHSLHGGTTQRKRRGDTGSIRLLLVGETGIGTSSLHGLGDSEDSKTNGMRCAEYSRYFQLESGIVRICFGYTHPLNISVMTLQTHN